MLELRLQAGLHLLLCNLMFILLLVVVFIPACFGITSQQLDCASSATQRG